MDTYCNLPNTMPGCSVAYKSRKCIHEDAVDKKDFVKVPNKQQDMEVYMCKISPN